MAEQSPPDPKVLQTPETGPSRLQLLLCKKCFEDRPQSQPDGGDATNSKPDANGVAELLAIATDAVADERERGRTLDTKTASLAGFSGLILTINGALVGPLFRQRLGSVGRPLAQTCFVLAMLCLLVAVLLAIVGVLMPQKYRGLGRDELRNFTSSAVQSHTAIWVQQSMLGALANIIAQDRPINDCKARLTKGVALFLALAFVLVAVEAVTLGFQRVGI